MSVAHTAGYQLPDPTRMREMRDACNEALARIGKKDTRVVAMTADQVKSFRNFAQEYPDRFFDAGVAEADMVGIAAGLALCGKVPFVTSIAGILTMRACEQIRDDVCLMNLNVRVVGHGAGLSYGPLGSTHHAVEDIAMMRAIPNMTVIVPADALEVEKAFEAVLDYQGPVYLRLSTAQDYVVYDGDYRFRIGEPVVFRRGKEINIFACGPSVAQALLAADQLEADDIHVGVVNIHTIKPLDHDAICEIAAGSRLAVTVEDHNVLGGLGSAIAELLSGLGRVAVKRIGVPDRFSAIGSREELFSRYGIDASGIARTVRHAWAELR